MAGQAIGYLEAWSAWADGVDIRSRVLWGLEIYWWARGAKVGAFIAGLTLLLDIIGPERIERYLRQNEPETGRLKDARDQYRIIHEPPFSPGSEDAYPPPEPTSLVRRISALLLVLMMLVIAIFSFLGFVEQIFLMALPGVVLLVGWKGLDVIAWFIAQPIAWIFNQALLLRLLRTVSLFLLAAAFHFDFLAS